MTVRAAAALLAVLTLAGCGGRSAVPLAAGVRPSTAATSAAPTSAAAAPLVTCGDVPVTHGPSKGLIGATTTGPATAQSGSTIAVQVQLSSLDGRKHPFESGAAPVLILQHGQLVGEYMGGAADSATETTVTPGQPNATSASVLLAGCPSEPVDSGAPDLTRKALPPGVYQLEVDLPDVTSSPYGDLVSAPMTLQVTADPGALPSCGDVPVPSGPANVGAQLTAPATAKAGSTVQVQVELRTITGKAEPFESGLPVDVLIVQHGYVVGRTDGPIAGVGIGVTVPASGTVPLIGGGARAEANLNSDLTLSGCPQTSDPSAPSPSPRRPLPPGTYQLVAGVQNGTGMLVTEPATLTVTAG